MKSIQLFEPDPHALYTLDHTARLADIPRRWVLVYYKHGLVSPVVDELGIYYFDGDAVRVLRRVERLRVAGGLNLAAIKVTFDLLNEVERLRSEVHFLRRWKP